MARTPASPPIRIAQDLLPSETRVEVENVRGDFVRVFGALPEKPTPDQAIGIRELLQKTSQDGTQRVLLVARELNGSELLSTLVLGALYGVGLDGRRTILIDFLVGNYSLLEPMIGYLRGVARMAGLRSQAQVIGALAPPHELLLGVGFKTFKWQGHEIYHLEEA